MGLPVGTRERAHGSATQTADAGLSCGRCSSKEPLIFDLGVRRFRARPIFSQHSNLDKHKFERFAQPGSTVMASVIAPVTYPPMPLLLYRWVERG